MATLEKPVITGSASASELRTQWFSRVIHSIEIDKLMLDNDMAHPDTKELYDAMIANDIIVAGALTKELLNQRLTEKAVLAFVGRIVESGHMPRKLAFDIAGSSLLVWAVVTDDDYEAEKSLYLAQAAVNAQFFKADYRVSTTIIDASDRLNTPTHYQEVVLERTAA